MNRPTDSLARPLVAILLAASSMAPPAHAAIGSHSSSPMEEVSEPDQLALARQAVDRGDNAEALSRYVRVLAARPRDLTALVGAGNAAVELGDFSAGLAFFGRAEEVDPHNGRVKAGLASALAQTEQPGAALKLFDEAVALGVPEEEIAGDRGLAWDLRGNPRRAQRDYALALANKPDHEVTMRLALSQAISGDRETALRTLSPWLAKQDQGAWRTRAFVLAITGDTKGASQAAGAVLPAAQASAMTPFFAKLSSLNSAQKAMAANFGYLPGDQPPAVQRALSASSAMAAVDTRVEAAATHSETMRTVAPIAPAPRASAPVPRPTAVSAPVIAVAQKPVAPASDAAPVPVAAHPVVMAAAAKPVAKPLAPINPAPPPMAVEVVSPPAVVARPVVVAAATLEPVAKPAPPETAVEAKPAVARVTAPSPVTPAGPPVVVAATEMPVAKPLPAADTVSPAPAAAPVSPPPTRPIVTLSPAEIAMLQAETAADAETEARADRELAAKEAPPPAPPAKAIEAHPVALVHTTMPAPARSAEPKDRTEGEAAAVQAVPPKPPAKTIEARAIEPDRAVAPTPLPAARTAVAKRAAATPPARPTRVVSLPLPADVARAFAALPHGSALSADAVIDKPATAAKTASNKLEFVANATDGPKPRKAAGEKAKLAEADDAGDARAPAKSLDKDADKDADKDTKGSTKNAKDSDKLASRELRSTSVQDKISRTPTAESATKTKSTLAESAAKSKTAPAETAPKAKTALADGASKAKAAITDSGAKTKTATATSDSTTKTRAVGERYWVQVAGGSNKPDLDKAWGKLKSGPAGSVLSGHTPSTTPLRATNRLLVGPFADMDEAQAFVNKLAGAGTSSFTFRSPADQKIDKLQGP